MLYLVATPIGNLGDMSHRAVEVLKEVDQILCEDTRTSQVLLNRYDIKKPLKPYHKFNEKEAEQAILSRLKEGKSIALISDAGTPGISDPGETLVKGALENDLKVTAIPGPSAFLMALQLSGFELSPFQFVGFLPKKSGELKKYLTEILLYNGVSVAYESPHRLIKLLELLPPKREISVSRELTKKFEETKRGTADSLLSHFKEHPPKGEFVVVINKGSDTLLQDASLEEEISRLQKNGASKSAITRELSQKFQLPKKKIAKLLG
ncbi:MAG: 16S rRNA (cytidine(1402)-2'-O)-methyltransferase [Chlamydiia bacterium]|nr:16S rRNA (cytidine(1402)-2'-O)-methyltransferase [Chlamydiia bacterium]